MIENGNLQKKQQAFAADKLQRFNYANISQVGADIGPGSYDINQQVGQNALNEAYKKEKPLYLQNREEVPSNVIKKKLM